MLSGILAKLEDKYYGFLDWLMERGVPVENIVGPLESKGINTFYIALGLLVLVLAGVGFIAYNAFAVPKQVIVFKDAKGNPLEGVNVVLLVDGVERELTTGPDGTVEVAGRNVELIRVSFAGYRKTAVKRVENGLIVVLEPRRYDTKVYVKDERGREVEATLRVYVDGDEVFSEEGSAFTLCFATAPTSGCIIVSKDSEIEFEAGAEGYATARKRYGDVEDLPSTVRLTLERSGEGYEEVATKTATVTFNVRYKDYDEPFTGYVYLAAAGSSLSRYTVRIANGVGTTTLAYGAYTITSVRTRVGTREVTVPVVQGKTLVVSSTYVSHEVVVEVPEEIFSIVFKITDENGAPLQAEVKLTFGDDVISYLTDEKGRVTFNLSSSGCGTYTVMKEGYESATGKACTGEEVKVALKKVIQKGTVRVIVYDQREEPVPNATVYLVKEDGTEMGLSDTTNSFGRVLFEEVPVGTYVAVAEFQSIVAESEPFEVVKDETTDVTVYLVPDKVAVTVEVTEEGIPVMAARVRAVSSGGRFLGEAVTDADGVAELELPAGLSVLFRVTFLRGGGEVTFVHGPEYIPPGAKSYEVSIDIPKTERNVEFIGVKNDDGEWVSSLERGREYWLVFRVTREGPAKFGFESDPALGVKVLSVLPEPSSMDEYRVEVELDDTEGTVIEDVMVKIKVPLAFSETVYYFTYSLDEAVSEGSVPVGMELTCSEYICYSFKVVDVNTGAEVTYDDYLKLNRNYKLELVVSPLTDEELTVELYMKDVSSGEVSVVASGVAVPGEFTEITYEFTPMKEAGYVIGALVKAGTVLLEDVEFGSWSVYIPDLGPLLLTVEVKVGKTGKDMKKLPDPYFLRDVQNNIYVTITDEEGRTPQLPVTVKLICETGEPVGTPQTTNAGSVIFTVTPACDEITVEAEALGYESASKLLQAASIDDLFIELPPLISLAEGNNTVTVSLESLAPFTVSTSYVYQDCNMRFTLDSVTLGAYDRKEADMIIEWGGERCLGLNSKLPVEFNVYMGGVYVGTKVVETQFAFGSPFECVKLSNIEKIVEGCSVTFEFNVVNGCDVDVEVDVTPYSREEGTLRLSVGGKSYSSGPVTVPRGGVLQVEYAVTVPTPALTETTEVPAVFDVSVDGEPWQSPEVSAQVSGLECCDVSHSITFTPSGDELVADVVLSSSCSWGGGALPATLDVNWDREEFTIEQGSGRVYLRPASLAPYKFTYTLYVGGREFSGVETLVDTAQVLVELAGERTVRWRLPETYDRVGVKLVPGGGSGCTELNVVTSAGRLKEGLPFPMRCPEGICNDTVPVRVFLLDDDGVFRGTDSSVSVTPMCVTGAGECYAESLFFHEFYNADTAAGVIEVPSFDPDAELGIIALEKDVFRSALGDIYQLLWLVYETLYDAACGGIGCDLSKIDTVEKVRGVLSGLYLYSDGRLELNYLLLLSPDDVNTAPGVDVYTTGDTYALEVRDPVLPLTVELNVSGVSPSGNLLTGVCVDVSDVNVDRGRVILGVGSCPATSTGGCADAFADIGRFYTDYLFALKIRDDATLTGARVENVLQREGNIYGVYISTEDSYYILDWNAFVLSGNCSNPPTGLYCIGSETECNCVGPVSVEDVSSSFTDVSWKRVGDVLSSEGMLCTETECHVEINWAAVVSPVVPPPPENNPPTVEITYPSNNAVFSTNTFPYTLTIQWKGSDPDNDSLEYNVDCNNDHVWEATGITAISYECKYDVEGTYTVRVVAHDGKGDTAEDTVTFTIQKATGPNITGFTSTIEVGEFNATITLTCEASVTNGTIAEINIADITGTKEILATCSNATFCTATVYKTEGMYSFECNAVDDEGYMATTTLGLAVGKSYSYLSGCDTTTGSCNEYDSNTRYGWGGCLYTTATGEWKWASVGDSFDVLGTGYVCKSVGEYEYNWVAGEAICNDSVDNDGDGQIDCKDPDCAGKTGPGGVTCCQSVSDCGDIFIDLCRSENGIPACDLSTYTCTCEQLRV